MGQPLNGYIIGALQEKRDRLRIPLVQSAISQRDAERDMKSTAEQRETRGGKDNFQWRNSDIRRAYYVSFAVRNGKHDKNTCLGWLPHPQRLLIGPLFLN